MILWLWIIVVIVMVIGIFLMNVPDWDKKIFNPSPVKSEKSKSDRYKILKKENKRR